MPWPTHISIELIVFTFVVVFLAVVAIWAAWQIWRPLREQEAERSWVETLERSEELGEPEVLAEATGEPIFDWFAGDDPMKWAW